MIALYAFLFFIEQNGINIMKKKKKNTNWIKSIYIQTHFTLI